MMGKGVARNMYSFMTINLDKQCVWLDIKKDITRSEMRTKIWVSEYLGLKCEGVGTRNYMRVVAIRMPVPGCVTVTDCEK